MEVRKWITYYACFFVAAFSAGLIIGYMQQKGGGPVAMAVEYSRVKSEADTAIISIICPGNELLYTYVVGEAKATPNLLTEVAGYNNVMSLSDMPIPEAGGFFGGSSIHPRFWERVGRDQNREGKIVHYNRCGSGNYYRLSFRLVCRSNIATSAL